VENTVTKKKILVVEDEETLLQLQTILLTVKGYEVEGVMDGQAALEAVAAMKPDLVLLDVMLPKIDGFEVCRRVKANEGTQHIPVILLTGKKDKEAFAMGKEAGADWFLTKPFKSAMLIESINRFLS
jgi:DNA-binding response OmpR family regulator